MGKDSTEELELKIAVGNEFSATFIDLHHGLDTALTKVATLGEKFGEMGQSNGLNNRLGMESQDSEVATGSATQSTISQVAAVVPSLTASSAEKIAAMDTESLENAGGVPTPTKVEQNQSELQQKAEHKTALFAIEQNHQSKTLELDKMTWDMKFKTAASATSTMSSLMQNLYVATGSKNKAMFEAGKGFAIAETIINTHAAAMGAYKSQASIPGIGPALGIAAAAAAIAAGAAQVQEISSTKPGGGSISSRGVANPSYSGGSPSAFPIPQRLETPDGKLSQHITVNIHTLEGTDVNWEKVAEDNIKPALEALKDRNVRLDILTT
jgi:hypothetical protein